MTPADRDGEPASPFDHRPAALVDGRGLPWEELRPGLSDAAGAEILREVILDDALATAVAEAGIEITDAGVTAEEDLLLGAFSDDRNTALRLLEELRTRRRLGTTRYRALLRRNAMLRALVRDEVDITEAAVDEMYDRAYGPKRQTRLITVADLVSAQRVLTRHRQGELFADLAVAESTDASATRGGLLEPISRLDPRYPPALRQAIWALPEIGAVSPPTLIDTGYALVQHIDVVLPIEPPSRPEVHDDLVRLVRIGQERVYMDRLAFEILSRAQVTIFDEELHQSWSRFRKSQTR